MEYFGTDSIRKGSITHNARSLLNGPPIALTSIGANWKMPGVMNSYMRNELVGDNFVVQIVCGHVQLGKRFAESCSYLTLVIVMKQRKHGEGMEKAGIK